MNFRIVGIALGMVAITGNALAQKPEAPKTPAALNDPAKLKEKAPETFKTRFVTSKGTFDIDVVRKESPNGADRFYNLVKNGFFNNIKFFRVVKGFVVQFGIHGDPKISKKWLDSNIQDDSVVASNIKGTLTFAKSGAPNSRSTQLFINLGDNARLDGMGFSSFGKVTKGMDVVEKLNGEYGETITQLQGEIAQGGNAYLEKNFPKLDYIKTATIVK